MNEARAAISGLRPPVLDDLGLAYGLASLARSIGGAQVTVGADECALPEHVEIALYRIAQEALQNVVKHAGTAAGSVVLRCDPGLVCLRVTNDGAGFAPAVPRPRHFRQPHNFRFPPGPLRLPNSGNDVPSLPSQRPRCSMGAALSE